MKEKLKPCPFCGSKEIVITDGYSNVGCWAECSFCGASTKAEERTHKECAKAWNRRAK